MTPNPKVNPNLANLPEPRPTNSAGNAELRLINGGNFPLSETRGEASSISDSQLPKSRSKFRKPQWYQSLIDRVELSLAQEFADIYSTCLRFDHERERWLIWDEYRWRPDVDGEVHRSAEKLAKERYHKAVNITDRDEAREAAKFAVRASSDKLLSATVRRAKHQEPIAATGREFDRDPWLLGVKNGVIDLKTGELRPGRPEDMLTKQVPVALEPEAKCPRWEQFLQEIFESKQELIEFIQRALGYSLTGAVNEQVFFLLHGTGSNGKSTLLDTIKTMLGTNYAAAMDFDALIGEYRHRHQFDLANIEGRRFVIASESDRRVELSSKVVKTLVGNGSIVANEKYKQPREVSPTHKLWLACNELPTVTDRTLGFWRRIRLVPFNARFEGENADKQLEATLQSELPGILAWAVKGCLLWQCDGLKAPAEVCEATDEYRETADGYRRFIGEMCCFDREAYTLPDHLKSVYDKWQADNRDAPEYGKGTGLKASLEAAGARYSRRYINEKQCRVYTGVRLVA